MVDAKEFRLAENLAPDLIELVEKFLGQSLFSSEKDRGIARDVLVRIEKRRKSGLISEELYSQALTGLNFLIPKRNVDGGRHIGGVTITPEMEKVFQSRLESEEVEVVGKDGPWGSLPEQVRKEIVKASPGVNLEITDTCTVKCPWCPYIEEFARRKLIRKKMGWKSLNTLLQYYRDNGPAISRKTISDSLYDRSEPFDAKWKSRDGSEKDYLDAAKLYWRLMRGKDRSLFTSTAVPLGEELRVLQFADFILKEKRARRRLNDGLRISLTNKNQKRVEAITNVLQALYDDPIFSQGENVSVPSQIVVGANRDENTFLTGKKWENAKEINLNDILGLGCKDGVVVGIGGVMGVVVMGASNEYPAGVSHFPVKQARRDGKEVYVLPHYQNRDEYSYNYMGQIVVTQLTLEGNYFSKEVVVDEEEPSRALLRVAGAVNYLELLKTYYEGGKEVFLHEIAGFAEKFAYEISVMRKHQKELSEQYGGSEFTNISMFVLLRKLEEEGYIDPLR